MSSCVWVEAIAVENRLILFSCMDTLSSLQVLPDLERPV